MPLIFLDLFGKEFEFFKLKPWYARLFNSCLKLNQIFLICLLSLQNRKFFKRISNSVHSPCEVERCFLWFLKLFYNITIILSKNVFQLFNLPFFYSKLLIMLLQFFHTICIWLRYFIKPIFSSFIINLYGCYSVFLLFLMLSYCK